MRFLYTLISTLALPGIFLRLWWRGRRLPGYRQRWSERFGFVEVERTDQPLVWVHAVSVGEAIAAVPVVEALLAHGDVQVLVTTMTPTGSERVTKLFGDRVLHSYVPYDLPRLLKRFIKRVRPSLLLIMETELWPNTLRACKQNQIPVLLLNARLSEQSARGYGLFPDLMQSVLQDLTHVAVQTQADARRFRNLGLPASACSVTGSIKFDLTLSQELKEKATALKDAWSDHGRRLIWIAASTHAGEEEQILEAFQAINSSHPDSLLVLVPRHPDRFSQVAALCENSGLRWLRRSDERLPEQDSQLILGDTMGEMLLLYGVADIAFVGGSLVPTGGHNLIEPAAWGLPLLSGPHLFNFAEVARLMLSSGALSLVDDQDSLMRKVAELLSDPELRRQRGVAARQVVDANRGALDKVIELVEGHLA